MRSPTCVVCRSIVILALAATFQSVSSKGSAGERESSWETGQRNRESLLRYLRPVLKAAGGGGRLYYRVQCWSKDAGDDFSYPQLELEAPSPERTGLDAVREIFKKSSEVTVTQDRNGMIGIRIGDVSNQLLETKINVLKLKELERYNPQEAMMAIERTSEVRAKMRQLGIVDPPTILHEHLLKPAPGLPHLPASFEKIAFDEALDQVARTFNCLVVYGECTRADSTHLISVEFVDIAGIEAFFKRNK